MNNKSFDNQGGITMDVREKLVKLVKRAITDWEHGDVSEIIADHLLSNGVTVHEWIPVKEHLPQENEPEGKVCEQVQVLLINGAVSTGWCNRLTKMWWHLGYGDTKFVGYEYDNTPVIAWQPLEQPPKGE